MTSLRAPSPILAPLILAAACVLPAGCATHKTSGAGAAVSAAVKEEQRPTRAGPVGPVELQGLVISFSDEYFGVLTQATDTLIAHNNTPNVRDRALSSRYYSISAAYNIASNPNPEIALLDMATMVSLETEVWKDYAPQVYGPDAKVVTDAYARLYTDIWAIARRAMTEAQCRDLQQIIARWHKDHPDQKLVSYVRFSDFADYRKGTTLVGLIEGVVPKLPLISTIPDASKEVSQLRLASERAMFIAQRYPILVGAKIDATVARLGVNPQVAGVLGDFHTVSEQAPKVAGDVTRLTDNVTRMTDEMIRTREKLFADLEARNADVQKTIKEANQTVANVRGAITDANTLLATADKTTASVQQLTADTRQTADSLSQVALHVDQIVERYQKSSASQPASTQPSKPFDIEAYTAAARELAAATKELNQLVATTDQILASPALNTRLSDIARTFDQRTDYAERQGRSLADHVTLRLIQAAAAVFAMLLMYRLLIWLIPRPAARKDTE